MIDPARQAQTRTPFASATLLGFPETRIVRHVAPPPLERDQVRVEFRGRTRIYSHPEVLRRELCGGRQPARWGDRAVIAVVLLAALAALKAVLL